MLHKENFCRLVDLLFYVQIKEVRWAGHVTWMLKIINFYRSLAREYFDKETLWDGIGFGRLVLK